MVVFLTIRFDLGAKTICELYKSRSKLELFFRPMKQRLCSKKILVSLIAYLLVHILKYSIKSGISMPDAMAAIGNSLLLKEPL